MVFGPKKLWWTTEAWKFKYPEANEPSETSFAMTRVGGVVLLSVSVLITLVLINGPQEPERPTVHPQVRSPWDDTATTPPPPAPAQPENRGDVPLVGYQVRDGFLEVLFRAPQGVEARVAQMGAAQAWGCGITSTVGGVGTDRVTVGLRLNWLDPQGYFGAVKAEECRLSGTWSPTVAVLRVAQIDSGASILTNGPTIAARGGEIGSTGPGQILPNLDIPSES